jgi:hypothetical protein
MLDCLFNPDNHACFGGVLKFFLVLILCVSLVGCDDLSIAPARKEASHNNPAVTLVEKELTQNSTTVAPSAKKDPILSQEPSAGGLRILYSLPNGGFEDSTSGWEVRHGYVLDTNVNHSGSASMRSSSTYYDAAIDPNMGDARAMWNAEAIDIKEGQRVFASAFMKTRDSRCPFGLRIGMDFKSRNYKILRSINGDWVSWGNDWSYRSIEGTVRPGEEKVTLWLQAMPYNCSAVGWFDDVELQITQPKE